MPDLVRFYIRHVVIGYLLPATFVGLLLWAQCWQSVASGEKLGCRPVGGVPAGDVQRHRVFRRAVWHCGDADGPIRHAARAEKAGGCDGGDPGAGGRQGLTL